MSESKTIVQSGGIGISGALFVAFVVLQLTGHIDWAWYWIAAPLWMPLALALAIVAVFFVIGVPIAAVIGWRAKRRAAARRAAKLRAV